MSAPGHLDFYTVVLFLHITAAIAAFGVTFAYPVIDQVVRTRDARALPLWHEAQIQISRRVVTPAAVVVLIAGIYMATDRWSDLSSGWWSGAFAILIVIVGLDHAVMIPLARRMRDRAALDAQSGDAGGTVTLSTEYERLNRQRTIFGGTISLLVVVAVFLMVLKPGV
ncbi:DUF2269 family protein [Conexibacter woesei]|uniref:Integral membrane protein n=1 Tax=Conexibacter woesei (strain DSM 14684 / CCUG 47730 / CIP 108061 / JCM 11494 / NBRC 100937 / ID131577) TaxID=469383 RepID=D3F0J8_CONWI|nr:DUF2269 family protein [Conexibacter woesei]ADB53932.1 conserved hypothetical protein [Conexibacter woesei DSM 14684]